MARTYQTMSNKSRDVCVDGPFFFSSLLLFSCFIFSDYESLSLSLSTVLLDGGFKDHSPSIIFLISNVSGLLNFLST